MHINNPKLWQQVQAEPEKVLAALGGKLQSSGDKLLQLYIMRVMLNKGMIKSKLPNANSIVEGSAGNMGYRLMNIADQVLRFKALPASQKEVEVAVQHWLNLKKNSKIDKIIDHVLLISDPKVACLRSNKEFHLFFLNFFALDIADLFAGRVITLKELGELSSEVKELKIRKVSVQDLINFLSVSIPDIIISLQFQRSELPVDLQNRNKMRTLYINRMLQWVYKTSTTLNLLNKVVLLYLINNGSLKTHHQSQLMQIVFRYFIAHHLQRNMHAVQILFLAYNAVQETVRFALAPQFALFLQQATKLGKSKMVQAMGDKSKWISEIISKLGSVQQLPLEPLILSQHNYQKIVLKPGQTIRRYFEAIENQSVGLICLQTTEIDIGVNIGSLSDFYGSDRQEIMVSVDKIKTVNQKLIMKKEGLYFIDLINKSTWGSNKMVLFQKVIFSPIELQDQDRPSWKSYYLPGVELSMVVVNRIIPYKIKKIKGTITIFKMGNYHFSITPKETENQQDMYYYETDNLNRFLQKLEQFFEGQEGYIYRVVFDDEKQKQVFSLQEISQSLRNYELRDKQKGIVIKIPVRNHKL